MEHVTWTGMKRMKIERKRMENCPGFVSKGLQIYELILNEREFCALLVL